MAANENFGDAGRIRFAPNGHFYVSMGDVPENQMPVKVNEWVAGSDNLFKALGYIDESGVTITPSVETDPISVWQSAVPVLYNLKASQFQLKAVFMETNALTTELFFGAKWVEAKDHANAAVANTWRLDLKSTPELKEFTSVIDWSQTVKGKEVNYRCVIPRAMISDRGAIQLTRSENGKYELTVDALDKSGKLGYVLTNDKMN